MAPNASAANVPGAGAPASTPTPGSVYAEESERPHERKFAIGREQFTHTDYVNLFLLAEEGERRFFNTSPHEWMDPVLEAISFRWPQEGPVSDRAI